MKWHEPDTPVIRLADNPKIEKDEFGNAVHDGEPLPVMLETGITYRLPGGKLVRFSASGEQFDMEPAKDAAPVEWMGKIWWTKNYPPAPAGQVKLVDLQDEIKKKLLNDAFLGRQGEYPEQKTKTRMFSGETPVVVGWDEAKTLDRTGGVVLSYEDSEMRCRPIRLEDMYHKVWRPSKDEGDA